MEARGGPSGAAGSGGGPSFTDARAELEEIVNRLERGDVELEEAVRLWKRGEELFRLCVERLDAARGVVEELGRAGEIPTMPLAGSEEPVPPDAA